MKKVTHITYVSALCIAGLFISGCPSLTLPPEPAITYQQQSWPQRERALQKIHHWQINGAFSLHQPQHTVIADYAWQQKKEDYWLRIYSTLDLYSMLIVGQPHHVSLQRSKEPPRSAQNPEQLMQQELGWAVPISHLFYWIRGLPAPGPYTGQWDRYGHLVALQQNQWSVHWSNYLPVGSVDLPCLFQLSRPPLDIKIVVKQWSL